MSSSTLTTTLIDHRIRWRGRNRFVVLECKFGGGEHFFTTWQAWRDDPQRPQQLHYLALVPQLTTRDDLRRTAEKFPQWKVLSTELAAIWPISVPGFHRIFLEREQVMLTLMFGDSAAYLRQIVASVDAFHLHDRSWQEWPLPLLKNLGRLAEKQASLDIPIVDEALLKKLEQVGFVFDSHAQCGVPKNTLHAHFAPRFEAHSPMTVAQVDSKRHAIVIGAGLAGSAACHRLVRRGWTVSLIENHAAVAQEASGNAAGIVMPILSRDDNPGSRLSRNAYLFAQHIWRSLGGVGNAFIGSRCGVLHIARNAECTNAQQLEGDWPYPADYAQWLDRPTASRLAGRPVSGGGWYFPAAGWVQPRSLCQAMLADCGTGVQVYFGRSAARLEREDGHWTARDRHGNAIASAPVAILANGCDALQFPQAAELPLTSIRGQITYIAADLAPAIAPVMCGEAYLTPVFDGICSVGASYDEDQDPMLRQDSQDDNLARLANMLPGWPNRKLPLAGRVGFRCVASDRLPLVGALPDYMAQCTVREPKLKDLPRLSGLHCLLGYASRGLIWAPLAAEILAAQLNGEPLPIEAELAAALDPARFLLKAHRRPKVK